jgi:hypothetical protein|tara:strand:+ start:57 stop:221 length:165 start_codon:yes stop_codon:yes gene_type:complete
MDTKLTILRDNIVVAEFVYSRNIIDKYFFKLLLNYLETKKNYQLNFSKLELIED